VIYTEIFFERLYENAWIFRELEDFPDDSRFQACGYRTLFMRATGSLVQANATFVGNFPRAN